MKTCAKCKVEKSLEQFGKWSKAKDGLKFRCKECRKAETKERALKHPDYFKEHYKKNAERIKARVAEHRKTIDPDASREYFKDHYRKNKDAICRRVAQWAADNPEKCRRYRTQRGDARNWAQWRNTFLIGEAYELAFLREQLSGFAWHVDHIVPLISKLVCGLHVENNLSVIPAVANRDKGNKYWPDMPS